MSVNTAAYAAGTGRVLASFHFTGEVLAAKSLLRVYYLRTYPVLNVAVATKKTEDKGPKCFLKKLFPPFQNIHGSHLIFISPGFFQ